MICICDHRAPKTICDNLKKEFKVIKLPLDPSLPTPVCGHSDLLIFRLENYLIARKSYYRLAKAELDEICKMAGLRLILSNAQATDKYPGDCGLCAAVSGKTIICRKESTDPEILALASELNYKILNVPQGYAKCSCVVFSDGSIVTSDNGIASVTHREGIETLSVSAGHISLPGYNYGFIGGSSGLCGNSIYFCGDLTLHPDSKAITSFAEAHGTKCISLGTGRLYDVGSLIFI